MRRAAPPARPVCQLTLAPCQPTAPWLLFERRLTHLFSSDAASPSYDPDFDRSPLPDWRPRALVDWAEKLYQP